MIFFRQRITANRMSQYFITNDGETTLANVIKRILPGKTESLDFLVGYFYFSGIEELYESIGDKKMRILVGLEMEEELQHKTANLDSLVNHHTSSKQEIRRQNYESLVSLFTTTDFFETKKQQEAFKIYYEKIKDGTLEIRKTKEPSHAKMYIFTYSEEASEGGDLPGTVITGSSNLTYRGLTSQNEINVRFHSKPEYEEAENIFNRLWSNATVLADREHIADFDEGVIRHIWFEKIYSPYLFYLRALHEYFYIDRSKRIRTPHEITKGKFLNLKYQEDAVRMALSSIEKHNGVMVADVVGLGKSIIASAVANNLGLRTIVIAPPHLVPQWEDYCEEFRITARVFSRGVIQKALEHYRSKSTENEQWLIIVDEAHNYRNEFTLDYAMLHELCLGNKVMLLTATPFNNQPSDIYSLIKLFQIPTKSTLQTVDNLGEEFRKLINSYKTLKKKQKNDQITDMELAGEVDRISSHIRNIISPLIVRRSRLDLQGIPDYLHDLENQKIHFPVVKDPIPLDYDLGSVRDLYLSTLQRIWPDDENPSFDEMEDFDFEEAAADLPKNMENKTGTAALKTARYQPIVYVKPDFENEVKKTVEEAGFEYNLFKGTQRNLAKFMRSMLVHRFESSQYAFKISLDTMLRNNQNIAAWAEKRHAVPIFKKGKLPDIEELYDSTGDNMKADFDDELEEAIEKFKARGLFEIKTEYLDESFFTDLNADIALLKNLRQEWSKMHVDPKLDRFIEILHQMMKDDPKRKIVVFSQFADTVDYLEEKLVEAGLPVFAYTSAKASQANKEIIKANFDAGNEQQADDYKILVATDAISEGYNLSRAGAIFNYDIPYNPTRVIQRVGRINRVNRKMFDELFIYNYFPTDIGEAETRTREISTLKMAMIHAIMGEDTKILTSDEELKSYFVEQYKKLSLADEQQSWDTPYRAELNQLIHSDAMKEALALPLRAKTCRKTGDEGNKGILVFARKGSDCVFKFAPVNDQPVDLSPQEAFDRLRCGMDEKGYAVTDDFEERYIDVKKKLFETEQEGTTEQNKRDALDKIRLILQSKACDGDYLEDLSTAIQYDAVSGYDLRWINRMKPAEYKQLPTVISPEYIHKILQLYDRIGNAPQTLILAEEIIPLL